MLVEIWSDVVCPWCYIGKRNLEEALAGFEHRDEVEVVWRSFELDPGAPPVREGAYAQRLARKYGTSAEQAQGMVDGMTATGAAVGLDLHFERARPGNTFDAHRLLHHAARSGLQGALKERLFAAAFTEGVAVGDPDALRALAVEVGLDADEVAEVLASDAHAAEVRADEARAVELEVTGVPFFVIDRGFGIPGAQPPETLLRVLERAWERAHPPALVIAGDDGAPGCEGDACSV
jgi:predicted DsbA family dithiol-disulfide isomerase